MSHLPLLEKFRPQFLWLSRGLRSRSGLKGKLLHTSPLSSAERNTLDAGASETRQQRRNAAFHLAFVELSVKYPGESRKARRAMARVRSKRNG